MTSPSNNIRLFNNLKDLYQYCENCLICGEKRKISISFGPEEVVSIHKKMSFSQIENQFTFFLIIKKLEVRFEIDSLQNSLNYEFIESTNQFLTNKPYKAKKPYLYFYFNSFCENCNNHTTSTEDIQIDLLNHSIKNFSLEKESICFQYNQRVFEFEKNYNERKIFIVEYIPVDDNSNGVIEKTRVQVPYVEYDFSNKEKLYNKIQTILTFG